MLPTGSIYDDRGAPAVHCPPSGTRLTEMTAKKLLMFGRRATGAADSTVGGRGWQRAGTRAQTRRMVFPASPRVVTSTQVGTGYRPRAVVLPRSQEHPTREGR